MTERFVGRPFEPVKACMAAIVALILVGCEADGSTGEIGVGTVAGALGGAALGAAGGGKAGGVLAGAAIGGLAGNMLVDRPADKRRAEEAETARDREYERRLAYERQSQIQAERTRQEIEEQRLYEEWKKERLAKEYQEKQLQN
ncbi:hypothetical protein [Petrachloros mirabilis]